jgi:hypothetical protein
LAASRIAAGEEARILLDAEARFLRRCRDVPVVQSIALDNDDIVAGDSRIAGFIAVRQPVHALVGTDQDDLVRNMLTCLVELRATPVIPVPAALAVANLPAA